jgi:hypothetical protein
MILDSVDCFVHHQAIIKESYVCFNLKPSGILFMKLTASLGERDGVDNIIFHLFLNGDTCRNIVIPWGVLPRSIGAGWLGCHRLSFLCAHGVGIISTI